MKFTRRVLGIGIGIGGFAVLAYLAIVEDSKMAQGGILGMLGSVVTFYFTASD